LQAVLKDWGFFALAAAAGVIESLLGLSLVASELSSLAYAEWAVLTAAMVVVGAASQWGLKTGYMQMVVDEPRRSRQRQSLRAGMIFLTVTGAVAGVLVALSLALMAAFKQWESTDVLWLLPALMALGNAQMLLVTDLRIRRKLGWLSWLTAVRVPFYAVVILGLQTLGLEGLFLVLSASLVISAWMFAMLALVVKPGWQATLRWHFLPAALRLGTPIMLGLVAKYCADATVHMGIRWLGSETLAGDWGRYQRILEAMNALYFGALMMAWSPNAILMAGGRSPNEVQQLQQAAHKALLLCLLGLPLSLVWSMGMQASLSGLETSEQLGPWVFAAVLARMAAFSALSMANYGMVVIRQYGLSLKFHLWELALTLVTVLSSLAMGYERLALVFIGGLPWLVVAVCLWKVSPELARRQKLKSALLTPETQ
jgi:hypothetical protein